MDHHEPTKKPLDSATVRRARERRWRLWDEVIAPWWRARGQAPCPVVIDWQGSPFPFPFLMANAELQAIEAWARREGVDLGREPEEDRIALGHDDVDEILASVGLGPTTDVSWTADGTITVWDDDGIVTRRVAAPEARRVLHEVGPPPTLVRLVRSRPSGTIRRGPRRTLARRAPRFARRRRTTNTSAPDDSGGGKSDPVGAALRQGARR